MDFWLIAAAVAVGAYVLWSVWKTHTHPAQVLVRQAANMNWVAAGVVKKDGYRNVRLTRGKEEAVIWYKTGKVLLVRPWCPIEFDDFIELERWLAVEEKSSKLEDDDEEVNEEILYYREIEKFIARHGEFEPFGLTLAADRDFGIASLKIRKSGYLAGKTADAVATLTLEALLLYDKNRKASLEFLAKHENEFQSAISARTRSAPSNDNIETVKVEVDDTAVDGDSSLGTGSAKGEVSPQDDAEREEWFRIANQGNPYAQTFIGMIYESGDGVPQDYVEAAKWHRRAADQGHADAKWLLARMYSYGKGFARDYAQAAKWYRLAAEQGHAAAQLALGVMYSTGEGVPESDVEALKWYRLAADQGN